VLYYTDYRFYERILESSWIFIEKNRDIWNTKHFQNSIIYYLLFLFFIIFNIFFSGLPPYSCQKILKIFVCFIVWIREFMKAFYKTMVFYFKKIWYIWNPKFHQNSLIYYFFLLFFSIFDIFFFCYFTYPNLSKNYWIFCSVLLEELEILSTNSGNC